jgi:3-hydroxyanthranilate 3,4-dioxygenase
METMAINFQKWIDEHRHLLKPPVGNKKVFDSDEFIVMVVGGPNSRKDYHIDDGPEFFYQLEGEMLLKTQQGGKVVDIPIRAGEIYLLAPNVPHSPQRFANSVGLVVERKRQQEEYFTLRNIEEDFPPVFDRFFGDIDKRTCKRCGAVMEPPPPRARS